MATTISGNGGAERYWRNEDGRRAVLCRNGVMLMQDSRGSRWYVAAHQDSRRWLLTSLGNLPGTDWQPDAGQAARAAVTRTGRQARRREEV